MKAKPQAALMGVQRVIDIAPAKPEVLTQAVVREPVSEGTVVTPAAVAEPAAKPLTGIFGKKAEVTSEPEGENIPTPEIDPIPVDEGHPNLAPEEAPVAKKSIFSKAS